MARCKSCSAPLLANTNRCQYCDVRNDVDLHAKHDFTVVNNASKRMCPHCDKALQTIKIQLDEPLHIERCNNCYGLFFDLGEIETLLEHSVSYVNQINMEHIDNINADRYRTRQVIKYIKCPVCQKFMHRTSFAQKSGVIVDSCRNHGFWLDSGEITHLMEWKKAGGQLLHDSEAQKKTAKVKIHSHSHESDFWQASTLMKDSREFDTGIVDLLSYVARKIF